MRALRVRLKSLQAWLPWLWVAWVLVLSLLVWKVSADASRERDGHGLHAADRLGPSLISATAAEFGVFVVEGGVHRRWDRDRGYAAEGTHKLAAALTDMAAGGSADDSPLRDRIEGIGAAAALLRDDRLRRAHASIARNAFVMAAEAIATVQASRYPHLDRAAAEVREAALSIRPDRPLLVQTDLVQRFFERSHEVLRAMAG